MVSHDKDSQRLRLRQRLLASSLGLTSHSSALVEMSTAKIALTFFIFICFPLLLALTADVLKRAHGAIERRTASKRRQKRLAQGLRIIFEALQYLAVAVGETIHCYTWAMGLHDIWRSTTISATLITLCSMGICASWIFGIYCSAIYMIDVIETGILPVSWPYGSDLRPFCLTRTYLEDRAVRIDYEKRGYAFREKVLALHSIPAYKTSRKKASWAEKMREKVLD